MILPENRHPLFRIMLLPTPAKLDAIGGIVNMP
jgi:hypothetical protein